MRHDCGWAVSHSLHSQFNPDNEGPPQKHTVSLRLRIHSHRIATFPFVLALHLGSYRAGLTFLSFPVGPGGPPYMLRDTSWWLFLSGFLYFFSLGNYAAGANVTWISPLRGDVYGSGDIIVGQWDVEQPVRSPSFRLCMLNGGAVNKGGPGSTKACGAAVRPTVQQSQADGSYVIHMVLPNVTMSSQCYLEMKDDFGKAFASPAFSYLPSVEENADPTGLDAEAMAVPDPSPTVTSASPATQPSPLHTVSTTAASQSALSLEDSHIPTPIAAYAVPLSLVSTILVAASGLAIHQRRKLRTERRREQETLKARQTLSDGHPALDPVGLGLGILTLGTGPAPAARSAAGSLRSLGHGHVHGREHEQGPASVRSASASMSRMRAWRRDVSRHESGSHAPTPDDADEKTYVARSDDGRSVGAVSGTARLPKSGGEPRRPGSAPFYASTGASRSQPRRTTVPASMFRESPIGAPYSRDSDEHLHPRYHRDYAGREGKYATYGRLRYVGKEEEEHGRLQRRDRDDDSPRRAHRAHSRTIEDYQDATADEDGVMARDIDLFPIPLSPAQLIREPASVSRPERLYDGHVAQGAFDFDKTPVPPRLWGANRSIYDVVARKVSRGDLV